MRKTLFSKLNIGVIASFGLLAALPLSAQTMTNEQMIKLLQSASIDSTIDTSLINPTNTPTRTTASRTTTTTIAEERLNYSPVVASRVVKLNDVINFYLRSTASADTPIEIYLLAFNSSDTPIKKIYIKDVFNEKVNVTKRYKLMINQDIIDRSSNATYIQIGYCIGGCNVSRSKLIKGKIILPRIQPLSSDSSTI